MIFAFFLQLSNHMWLDQYSDRPEWSRQDPWTPFNNVDESVFDRTVDFIAERGFNMLVIDLGDGVRYRSHPEIAAPDAWEPDRLRRKLNSLRARGIEPVPKLNFSCGHSTWQKEWRYRTGLPEHIRFCRDLIGEVCELFDRPRLFHLGLDEERLDGQKTRGVAIVRNEKVFWSNAFELFDECRLGGSRPWVFSDYYWNHPDVFERMMPKSVVQSNWYYGVFDPDPAFASAYRVHTYDALERMGYDQIPVTSTYQLAVSPIQCAGYCKKTISPEHLLGFVAIPWHNTTEENYYSIIHNAGRLRQAREKYFPETL